MIILHLYEKQPTNILHVCTNDAQLRKTAKEMYDELINLKNYIQQALPKTKVSISCPILRTDNQKANHKLNELDSKLKGSQNDIIVNDNLDGTCLGKKGLHLNQKGSGRLALNIIKSIQGL